MLDGSCLLGEISWLDEFLGSSATASLLVQLKRAEFSNSMLGGLEYDADTNYSQYTLATTSLDAHGLHGTC